MKHWKQFVLLATGFALMMPMSAMAAQENTGNQKMVTVEVKNVKGGALPVWYFDENVKMVYIPNGEKTEVPMGTELHLVTDETGGMMDQYGYPWVDVAVKDVYVSANNGEKEKLELGEYGAAYTADSDCVIEADFGWTVNKQGYTDSGYWLFGTAHYENASVLEAKIKAYKDGKEIKLSDVKGLGLGYSGKYNLEDPAYLDQFELTSTGIRSKKKMPMGDYKVPVHYETEDGTVDDTICYISVGDEVKLGHQVMAVYKLDDGTEDMFWDINREQFLLENPNPDKNEWDRLYADVKFDGENTTIGKAVQLVRAKEEKYGVDHRSQIAGYTKTDEFVDYKDRTVNENSTGKLKDIYQEYYNGINFRHAYKKGSKLFKPAMIERLPESEIVITDSFITKAGKRYYYDNDGNIVKNAWVEDSIGKVFCGEDGMIVTNGIAGKSMEDGLYYVDADGFVQADKNETIKNGFITYTIVNGKVTELTVDENVATPSNASKVTELADGLEIALSRLTDKQKTAFADKLSVGIGALSENEKNQLDDATIEKTDELLAEVYGISAEIDVTAEEGVEDSLTFGSSDVTVKGALAAAGIKSEDVAAGKEVTVKITQLAASASNATAANATKRVLKFKAELYVSGEKVSLKAPIIIEVVLPEEVQSQYPAASYTFKVEHVMDNGKSEMLNPSFSDNGAKMSIRTNAFSTFELLATKKTASTSGGSSYGHNGSGRHASKNHLIGKWMKDANGWWYWFYNATWPKNQWVELEWNGVTSWYYFDANGYMVTGWKKDGDQWYYLNSNSDGTMGAMVTGWKKIDNIWYYFSTVAGGPKGSMLKNATTPDGYQVGADGAWVH